MNNDLNLIFTPIIIVIIIWTLIWKGFALWKAAKNGDKIWFIIFLIVNLLGTLEILYIFIFSKDAILKRKYKNNNIKNNKELN